MAMTVNERARAIATFRAIEVRMMEMVAGWTPTTPEMDVKVLFGRHIYDFAQHADALGKRTFELRQPMHYTLPPDPGYAALLTNVTSHGGTAERLSSLYAGVLPGLVRRYREYVAKTDPILDEPSIDIMNRIVSDLERQMQQASAMLEEIGASATDVAPLTKQESSIRELVAR